MSDDSMRYDEFLEQIGDGLLSTQDFLEILEEAAESELQTLEDRAAWATRANVPSRASVEAYNVRFVLDRLNDAITDLSAMQEDIRDELEDTPGGLRLP